MVFAASDDVPTQPGHRVRQAVAIKGAMAEEANKILHSYITGYENYPHPARVYPMKDIFSFFLAAFISCWSTVSFVRLGL